MTTCIRLMREANNNDNRPRDHAGLAPLLAGTKSEEKRADVTASVRHILEAHPSGFFAHLTNVLMAHAKSADAAAGRIETAAEVVSDRSGTLPAKLSDAQVQQIAQALGERVERAAGWARFTHYVVNGWLVGGIGLLCALIGAAILGWFWYQDHHAITDTNEYWLAQALTSQGGYMSCTTEFDGNLINVDIQPGQGWTTRPAIPDAKGKIRVVIYNTSRVRY
jgi:hypothetical protein